MITESTREKLKQSKLGNKNPNFGKTTWNKGIPMSDTAKKKLSDAKKGKPSSTKGMKIPKLLGNKHCVGRIPWNKGKNYKGWKWKNGIRKTPELQAVRNLIEYKIWRKAIFERDNFTCQKTGQRGGRLEAHHINNFAEKEELRFAIDNGITLSVESHQKFHKIYGKKNNTREQIDKFLE